MNRVIKFRQAHINQDGSFSHFSYWGTIDQKGEANLDGGCFSSPTSSSGTTKQWHDEYMGKDSSDKDIYEGDIWAVFSKQKGHDGKILYQLSLQIDVVHGSFSGYRPSQGKVIGNIHQHPELLNK